MIDAKQGSNSNAPSRTNLHKPEKERIKKGKKRIPQILMGALSSRRLGWDKKIWRALTQSCRISPSDSWTCFPPFPSSSLLIISSNTPLSIIPSIVIIFQNSFPSPKFFKIYIYIPSPSSSSLFPPQINQPIKDSQRKKKKTPSIQEWKRSSGIWAVVFYKGWIELDSIGLDWDGILDQGWWWWWWRLIFWKQ